MAAYSIAAAVAIDPTFALGHATLALLGHEMCVAVDVQGRLRDALTLAPRSTERERSHVHAVAAHVAGDSRPLVHHLRSYPRDAVLLSTAVPTIAFAGVGDTGIGLGNVDNADDVFAAMGHEVFGGGAVGWVMVHLLAICVLTSASASTHSSSTPASAARRRPASKSSGVRSLATTSAPRTGNWGAVQRAGNVTRAARAVSRSPSLDRAQSISAPSVNV